MGTVFKQTERKYHRVTPEDVRNFVEEFDLVGSITRGRATLEIIKLLEYRRRTDFLVDNGDRWDEQIGGLAMVLDNGLNDGTRDI